MPAAGSWAMTSSLGRSLVTRSTTGLKPALRSVRAAEATSAPTTVGTAFFSLPASSTAAAIAPPTSRSASRAQTHQRGPCSSSSGSE